MKAKGSVFKYGDNVDTDVIIPARYLNSSDPAELASHCMEDIDREFIHKVKKGDIIVVEKIKNKKEELKIGDVLVFQYNDTIIVHRIIKIENGYFYTKGDANTDPDDYPIPEGDVLGKAVLRMPVVGKPIIWLNELLEKSK